MVCPRLITAFGLSSTCYSCAFYHIVAILYLCVGDSDRQIIFYQSKISNYGGHRYVEKLEL